MEGARSAEYVLVRKTAEEYRRKGYDVSLDAALDFLPDHRADLIVRKGDHVKVIEVKTRGSLAASSAAEELARAIDSKPGWSFELLLVAEAEKLEPPEGAHSFDRGRILERVEEAEAVLGAGHIESAFLLAWSACEAAIRMLLADQGVSSAGITSAGYVFGQAVFLGVISRDEYSGLSDLQKYRNAIVHGYSYDDLGEQSVTGLIETVRDMATATA